MTRFPQMHRLNRACLVAAGGICLILLSGCGDDKPVTDPGPDDSGSVSSAPAPAAPAVLGPAPPPQTPDPLLSGAGAAAGSGGGVPTNDPLLHDDPLMGPSMPTDHSHWLRGQIHDAHLAILLNGIRQGVYSGVVDQDITMKLRAGINSVTFVYTPNRPDAAAQMNLVESEHDPPIPPLVTFQSVPLPEDTTTFQATTQSYTFFAK